MYNTEIETHYALLSNRKVSKEHKGCDENVFLSPSACSIATELGAKNSEASLFKESWMTITSLDFTLYPRATHK